MVSTEEGLGSGWWQQVIVANSMSSGAKDRPGWILGSAASQMRNADKSPLYFYFPVKWDCGNETEGELERVSPVSGCNVQKGCSRDLQLSLSLHSRGQVWAPGVRGIAGPWKA